MKKSSLLQKLKTVSDQVEGLALCQIGTAYFYKVPGSTYWRAVPDVALYVLLILLKQKDVPSQYASSRKQLDSAYSEIDPPYADYQRTVAKAYEKYQKDHHKFVEDQKILRQTSYLARKSKNPN